MFDPNAILGAVASGAVAVVAWAIRLESRISTQERTANAIQESVRETVESIDKRLGRIEDAIVRKAYGE